jgi:hypothetical protein
MDTILLLKGGYFFLIAIGVAVMLWVSWDMWTDRAPKNAGTVIASMIVFVSGMGVAALSVYAGLAAWS